MLHAESSAGSAPGRRSWTPPSPASVRAIELNPNFAGPTTPWAAPCAKPDRSARPSPLFAKPSNASLPSTKAQHNLLYALHFDPDTSPQENFAEHLRWAARFAEPLRSTIQPHGNSPDPDRPLRIAYVSPDLIRHPIGYFMEPILEQHDRARVQVFCYADVDKDDEVTARLREHTDIWCNTYGLNDEQLARQIASDGIDVLIDLVQHAVQPARCLRRQAGAGDDSSRLLRHQRDERHGLVHYRSAHEPAGRSEQWFTEKLLRLADCYWCYRPSAGSPPVMPAACRRKRPDYFWLAQHARQDQRGAVIDLWAKVLKTVPSSRLMVHATNGDANLAALRDVYLCGHRSGAAHPRRPAPCATSTLPFTTRSTSGSIRFPMAAARPASMRSGWACR